jgi:hypothetical protein
MLNSSRMKRYKAVIGLQHCSRDWTIFFVNNLNCVTMMNFRIIGSGLSIRIIAIIPGIDLSENHCGEKYIWIIQTVFLWLKRLDLTPSILESLFLLLQNVSIMLVQPFFVPNLWSAISKTSVSQPLLAESSAVPRRPRLLHCRVPLHENILYFLLCMPYKLFQTTRFAVEYNLC